MLGGKDNINQNQKPTFLFQKIFSNSKDTSLKKTQKVGKFTMEKLGEFGRLAQVVRAHGSHP